jgi:spoIIIJ-associated protein
MSSDKKDFYGKEVPDAIRKACETLNMAQERLDIEVLETGSTGIFGLIRKKAHIRVIPKPEVEEGSEVVFEADALVAEEPEKEKPVKKKKAPAQPKRKPAAPQSVPQEKNVEQKNEVEEEKEVSPEGLDFVKTEISRIVELMGCPSTVEIEASGISVTCTLRGDFEEFLTGPEGKTLDSMQYLLRKIVARKVTEQLRLTLNVGDYREKRLDELKIKAVELAALVKEDGKTQVLPALNPSERRTIHMILQEDKDIRSRSVGDGLFKKILIYKPGKGGRPGGRKRSNSKGRQTKPAKSGTGQKNES